MIQRKALFIRPKGATYIEYIIVMYIYATRDIRSKSQKTVIITPSRRNGF